MSTETNLTSKLLTLLRERDDDVDRYDDALLLIAERIDSLDSQIDSITYTDDMYEELNDRVTKQARMHAKLIQRVSKLEQSRAYTEVMDGNVHLSEAEKNELQMSDSLAKPNGPERRAMAIVRNWDNWALSTPQSEYLDITTGNLDKLLEQATNEKLDNKQVYDAMERAETLTDGKLHVTMHQFGGKGRKRKILQSSGEQLILTEDALSEAVSQLEPDKQNDK